MNRWTVVLCMLIIAIEALGQTDDLSNAFDAFKKSQMQQFDSFKTSQQSEYDAFRRAQNEQYAAFMREGWEAIHALPAIQVEKEKEVEPVVYELPTSDTLAATATYSEAIDTKSEVIVVPNPSAQPSPLAPVQAKDHILHKTVSVSYYGTLVSVGFPVSDNLKIQSLNEKGLADAWLHLSNEKYDITLSNVLNVRDAMSLCDWGYIEMLQAVSEKQYGKTNEAVLMQAYLLAQSNYKVRLAYGEGKLYILVASEYSILGMSRYEIDSEYFYPLQCELNQLKICKAFFENEKAISLQLREEQKLAQDMNSARRLSSKFGIVANVAVNKNEIEFFENYPSAYFGNKTLTRWVVYANTPLSRCVKESLYPTLQKSITGLNERDAVNKILNFVQTAFTYGYDDQVWGSDRAFFALETLHYPYSDCEDRSILFARLVRDLIGLDVVLIYYPGHLATAVAFAQDVNGDYLVYKGRRYTVCDPTYVNAPVGITMPGMNNKEAQVIALK